jgi:hypothetical protein
MDDVFASSDDFDTLLGTLDAILQRAIQSRLRFCPKKTRLFVSKAVLGGTAVSKHGVKPDLDKVAAIVQWPNPTSARDVLSFVNTVAVHRSFIKDFGLLAKPLYDLTKGVRPTDDKRQGALKRSLDSTDITAQWGPHQQTAFAQLKACLTTFPICVGPTFGKPFIVTTDASAEGFGGHLQQEGDDGKLRTIAWASRPTSDPEKKLHSSYLELAAVKWALDQFGKYLYGQSIILRTDCQAVRDMLRADVAASDYRAAWKEAILCHDIISFEHVGGTSNTAADALSRSAIPRGATSPQSIDPTWESAKGICNDLSEVPLRRLTPDPSAILLQRFEGDPMEPIVRGLLPRTEADEDDDAWDLLLAAARSYYIDDGQLCKRVAGKPVAGKPVTVLPGVEGLFVLRDVHERNGHFGRDLVLAETCRSFIWPRMRAHVDEVLAQCGRCRQFGQRFQRLLLMPIVRFRPFQTIAMDFLFMPRGRNGHNTILVAVDLFSKFLTATSFKGPATTRHTITMLEKISNEYATPEEILTDNGAQFQNRVVAEWCREHKARQMFSAPYAHVGAAENANHLVLERLRRLCSVDLRLTPNAPTDNATVSWVTTLPAAVAAINDRKVPFLANLSPREVLLGLETAVWSGEQGDVTLRLVQMEATRMDVLTTYATEQNKRRAKTTEWNTYKPEIGDIVATYDPSGDRSYATSEKLKPKWRGPFRVVDVRTRSVRVEHLNGLPREGWIGWARLRPW